MGSLKLDLAGGKKLNQYLQALARRMRKGKVRVGFLEGSKYPSGLSIAQVAFWNNFGTSRAPARPFFSNTIRDESPDWGQKLAVIAKAQKFDTRRTLETMGEVIKDQVVTAIVKWPADNAPATIERKKGVNKGLIDKGLMQRAVDFEVDV